MSTLRALIDKWKSSKVFDTMGVKEYTAAIQALKLDLKNQGYVPIELDLGYMTPDEFVEIIQSINEWCEANIAEKGSHAIVGGTAFFTTEPDAVMFKLCKDQFK